MLSATELVVDGPSVLLVLLSDDRVSIVVRMVISDVSKLVIVLLDVSLSGGVRMRLEVRLVVVLVMIDTIVMLSEILIVSALVTKTDGVASKLDDVSGLAASSEAEAMLILTFSEMLPVLKPIAELSILLAAPILEIVLVLSTKELDNILDEPLPAELAFELDGKLVLELIGVDVVDALSVLLWNGITSGGLDVVAEVLDAAFDMVSVLVLILALADASDVVVPSSAAVIVILVISPSLVVVTVFASTILVFFCWALSIVHIEAEMDVEVVNGLNAS